MAYFYWFFENVEVGERRRSKQKGIIIPLLLLTLSFKETPWPAITLCAASLSLQTDKTVKCLLCLLLFSMSQRKVCFEYGLCHSQFLEIQCQLRLWGRMLTKKKKKDFSLLLTDEKSTAALWVMSISTVLFFLKLFACYRAVILCEGKFRILTTGCVCLLCSIT